MKSIKNKFKNVFTIKKKPKSFYYIDRTKLENNFNIILERAELIKDSDTFKKANEELILYNRWYLFDILTVLVHLVFLFILPIPIIAVIALSRIYYAPYSLIPDKYLITVYDFYFLFMFILNCFSSEDIVDNFWVLPSKLFYEEADIHYIIFGILIYWVISIMDLIYYYT